MNEKKGFIAWIKKHPAIVSVFVAGMIALGVGITFAAIDLSRPVVEESMASSTESATETKSEAVTEMTENITEALTEKTEQVTEPVTEKMTEPVTEKITEPVTELVTEKVTEPVQEKESVSKTLTDKIVKQTESSGKTTKTSDKTETKKEDAGKSGNTGTSTGTNKNTDTSKNTDTIKNTDTNKNTDTSKNTDTNNGTGSSGNGSGNSGNKTIYINFDELPGGKGTTEAPKTCQHAWKNVYKTVHHDAVYETVTVPAYDEQVVAGRHDFCKGCHMDLTLAYGTADCADARDHIDDCPGSNGYYTTAVYDYIHHEAETFTDCIEEAWDEQVIDYTICSKCGERK